MTWLLALGITVAPLDVHYSVLEGVDLTRAGRTVDIGFLGGHGEAIFAGVPEALDNAKYFRAMRVVGTLSMALGLATLVSEAVMIPAAPHLLMQQNGGIAPLAFAMLLPGLVLCSLGALLWGLAPTYLADAVGAYNAALYRR